MQTSSVELHLVHEVFDWIICDYLTLQADPVVAIVVQHFVHLEGFPLALRVHLQGVLLDPLEVPPLIRQLIAGHLFKDGLVLFDHEEFHG